MDPIHLMVEEHYGKDKIQREGVRPMGSVWVGTVDDHGGTNL
jgi:hypothetical protein